MRITDHIFQPNYSHNIMSQSSSASGGIGFSGLLAIVFITLKLTGVIGWSWWWVLAPLWVGLGLAALLLLVVFIIAISR